MSYFCGHIGLFIYNLQPLCLGGTKISTLVAQEEAEEGEGRGRGVEGRGVGEWWSLSDLRTFLGIRNFVMTFKVHMNRKFFLCS